MFINNTQVASESMFVASTLLGGTLLDGALSDAATTITVDSTADFASSGGIRINGEVISYTGKTATTFTGCTRGFDNTTAAAHSTTDEVNERYSSGILSMSDRSQVQTHILSSDDGLVTIHFFGDAGGTDYVRTLSIPYTAANGFQLFSAPAFTPYVEYHFAGSTGVTQTDFFYETKFLMTGLSPQVLGAEAFISPAMVTQLNRSIIVGKTSGGDYNNVAIEPVSNALQVAIPRSAFGELETISPTPVIQTDFIYNVNADMVDTTLVGSGTVTQDDAMVVLQTTAAASSSATVATKRFVKYRPGQGVHVRGTAIFTTGVANSQQLFGCGDADNGFFFGFDGASYGILHRNDGVDTWTPQASWNGDKMDGSGPTGQTIDPTKGNVYQVSFQWLGFGQVTFAMEDSVSGRFVTVHTLNYANTATVPSLSNPSFPIIWEAENSTNTSNITVKGASCCAEVEGKLEYLGPTNAVGNTKTGVTTALTNVLTLRNKTTYQTLTNRTPIKVLKYTVSVDGTKPAEFQMIKDATLGGSPSYTDVSTNTSVIDYDTAGTTVTGGTVIDFGSLASAGSLSESGTTTTDVELLPGETLTLAVNATTSTTDATVTIRWVEDF
jgi:hypothetical protein